MFQVIIAPKAEKYLRKLKDRSIAEALLVAIQELEKDPYDLGEVLWGDLEGYHSLHCLNNRYRAVYKIVAIEDKVIVEVVGIRSEGDRKDVYAVAKRWLT